MLFNPNRRTIILLSFLLIFLGLPGLLTAQNVAPTKTTLSFTPAEQQYLRDKQEIKMCIDPAWLPLEAIQNGKHIGMTAEYMHLFSAQLGIPITLVPTATWPEAIEFAKQRKCDIFSLAMATPERETYMDFSHPYLSIPLVMATKTAAPFFDDITTLTDKKIGMVEGYAFNELLRNRYPDMEVVDVPNAHTGLKMVARGKIFGFVGTLATVGYAIQKDFVGELKVSGKFDQRWQLGVGSRNDEPLLVKIFDKVITSLTPATQQTILNHWIAVRYEQRPDYRRLWQVAPFIVALILVLLYRTYTLGKYNHKLESQNLKIQHQAEQLQETEHLLRFTQHAVEHCVFPIVWVKNDPVLKETSIIHANRAAAAILGYEVEEMIGFSLDQIDADITPERWRQETEGMQQQTSYTLTSHCLHKDGSTFPVELYLSFFEYEHQSYHFAFFMDISREQEMKEKLHRSMKMEAVGLMAGGVAHDLNNILSGIISYPELLLLKLPKDNELRPSIQAIHDAGLRAAEVVADMLTVTRGTAASREIIDMNDLIRDLIDSPECRDIAQGHDGLLCEKKFEPELLSINASPIHIHKSLMNLLFNGAEAMEFKGTMTMTTRNEYIEQPVSADSIMPAGEYVVVSVADTGPGITKTDMGHIFEPFYSKKVMGKSGTGLGLTIVWNTMQDHNGEVLVNSDENGTTFTLYFPATRTPVICKNEPHKTLTQGQGQRILVVDDEPIQRDIATQLLTSLNYTAITAPSGEEGLNILKEHDDIELVLLDMLMEPGINGRQTLEKMLEIKPDLKAIIASGFSKSSEVKKALEIGSTIFIRKPYTMLQLAKELEAMLF